MPDTMTVNDTEYTVLRLLGKGKGGYSYLVTDGERRDRERSDAQHQVDLVDAQAAALRKIDLEATVAWEKADGIRVDIERLERLDQERDLLADRLAQAPFADGEALTRQGAVADWLYIIGSGRAEVRLFTAGGDYTVVKTLGPGDVLGEMGLLTGEPRTATVTALGETVCYRLDRESFRGVLASRPEIAEGIAAMLARRRVELNAARAQQADAAVALKDEERNLLGRIRKFFDL